MNGNLKITCASILAQAGQPHPCASPFRNHRQQKAVAEEAVENTRVANPLIRSPEAKMKFGFRRSERMPTTNLLMENAMFWQLAMRPKKKKK